MTSGIWENNTGKYRKAAPGKFSRGCVVYAKMCQFYQSYNIIYRQRTENAVRFRLQSAGLADGSHDLRLFVIGNYDHDKILLLLQSDAEIH